MKKELFRMWCISVAISWVLAFAVGLLVHQASGNAVSLLSVCITSTINAVIISSVPVITWYLVIAPKNKYLESNDLGKPTFMNVSSCVVDISNDFDFKELYIRIAHKWIISYANDAEKTLKFRTNIGFWSWGTGAWLKCDTGKIYIDCFSMGIGQKKLVNTMQKAIESCIKML